MLRAARAAPRHLRSTARSRRRRCGRRLHLRRRHEGSERRHRHRRRALRLRRTLRRTLRLHGLLGLLAHAAQHAQLVLRHGRSVPRSLRHTKLFHQWRPLGRREAHLQHAHLRTCHRRGTTRPTQRHRLARARHAGNDSPSVAVSGGAHSIIRVIHSATHSGVGNKLRVIGRERRHRLASER